LVLFALLVSGQDRASWGAESVLLAARSAAGRSQNVRAVIEIRGELKLNPDGTQVRRLPMEVKADLSYAERFLSTRSAGPLAARKYGQAEAIIRMKDNQLTQTLRDDRTLVLVHVRKQGLELVSAGGPLTREELELIDVPGSSAVVADLLPGKTVAVGAKWKLADDTVIRLVGLDAVGEQSLEGTLTKVDGDVAIIDLAGKVSGAVGGITSEMDVLAKLNFDVRRQAVTWLALQFREQRAIGHAQPGYDALVRVRMQIEPAPAPPELSDQALAGASALSTGQSLLEFRAEKAGIEVVHDRRWRVLSDRFDTVILRMVDRGELIAQCNIVRLVPLPKGQELSLAAFQQDVEKALASSQGQIVDAARAESENGLRLLRITVAGMASELPIQWIYYHVSSPKGYRATLVFTMKAKLAERFASADRELIESLVLGPSPLDETKEPTPAAGAKSAAAPLGPKLK
jgi:hypothetical protein